MWKQNEIRLRNLAPRLPPRHPERYVPAMPEIGGAGGGAAPPADQAHLGLADPQREREPRRAARLRDVVLARGARGRRLLDPHPRGRRRHAGAHQGVPAGPDASRCRSATGGWCWARGRASTSASTAMRRARARCSRPSGASTLPNCGIRERIRNLSTSVVVVTHKPRLYLDRCLASVAEQADEIVVVDNASEGDSASRAAERYGARYVRMSSNVGFAAGVNAGVDAAKGDHLALLNDDAFAGSPAGSRAAWRRWRTPPWPPWLRSSCSPGPRNRPNRGPGALPRVEPHAQGPPRDVGRGRRNRRLQEGRRARRGDQDGEGFWTSGAALLSSRSSEGRRRSR